MTTLTPTLKKKITADWDMQFPDFGIYRPMWLMRRAGPLIQGLVLERSSGNDDYLPTWHVHNLLREFPTISLTMSDRLKDLKGASDRVRVRWHDDHIMEASERMRKQARFPLSGPLQLDHVIQAYLQYISEPLGRSSYYLYEDIILLLLWCGKRDEAVRFLKESLDIIRQWSPNSMASVGGPDAWYASCLKRLDNSFELKETLENEIVKHKLQRVPTVDLICT